jgi:type I restriction enzyme S subunit
MKWPECPLSNIAERFLSGGTPSTKIAEYWAGNIPWITGADIVDGEVILGRRYINELALNSSATNVVPKGSLLMVTRTGVGKIALAPTDIAISQDFTGIVLKQVVDPKYALTAIRYRMPVLLAAQRGATIKGVTRADVENLEIPIPALSEQQRIVDILSRAEGIVRLRREAQKKAAEIIPALFLDMFGDPGPNPKGWPALPVRDFVERFEGGKNIQAGENGTSEFRILKVSAVTSGIYIEREAKPAPFGYTPPISYIVKKGDLLFSRANTEQLVGATALVDSTDGKTLLPDKLWRFVWSRPVSSRYIHALFQSGAVRRELGKLSTGTSASMRNISQAKLFGLELPIAPIDKQQQFAKHVEQIRSVQAQQSIATQKAEATLDALLARVFNGSKTSWET